MGVVPGKKFVWLKAKGVSDINPNTIRFDPRYARLLKISPEKGDLAEVKYEGNVVFEMAKVELSEAVTRGEAQVNEAHLKALQIPDGAPLFILGLLKIEEEKKEKVKSRN